MISRKYNFVFQHIPKCAGISVLNFFIDLHKQQNCIGDLMYGTHIPFSAYKKDQSEYYEDSFKFTFVRNPWDRVVSLFEFRKIQAEKGVSWPHWPETEEILNDSFEETLKKSKNQTGDKFYLEEGCVSNHWLSSKILREINFIGRFERMNEDFEFIKQVLGIDSLPQLPHDNKIERKHYSEYYNDDTRKIVADKYADDIRLFGYKFED
jgi:chondroitin 4-sulfotransferase 11